MPFGIPIQAHILGNVNVFDASIFLSRVANVLNAEAGKSAEEVVGTRVSGGTRTASNTGPINTPIFNNRHLQTVRAAHKPESSGNGSRLQDDHHAHKSYSDVLSTPTVNSRRVKVQVADDDGTPSGRLARRLPPV